MTSSLRVKKLFNMAVRENIKLVKSIVKNFFPQQKVLGSYFLHQIISKSNFQYIYDLQALPPCLPITNFQNSHILKPPRHVFLIQCHHHSRLLRCDRRLRQRLSSSRPARRLQGQRARSHAVKIDHPAAHPGSGPNYD